MGTVYNMMRDHEKAQEYFIAAQQVAGHDEPDKNDLWNMGIAPRLAGRTTLTKAKQNVGEMVEQWGTTCYLESSLGRGDESAKEWAL